MPYLWGAVIGPEDDIVIPTEDAQTDYEAELSVVIGQTARWLTEETAMDAVFGFTIVNDVNAREVMVREKMQVMLSVTSNRHAARLTFQSEPILNADSVR